MAFSTQTLRSDLYTAFKGMQSDDDFANNLAKAVKDFGESGDVITADSGVVSSGTFTGAGKGRIKLTDSLCSAPIKAACKAMLSLTEGGDAILASAIGSGVQAMVTAGEVSVDVAGTVITPAGVPTPMSGSAKGTLTCQNASLISSLISTFRDMKDRYDEEGFDGDDYLADKLSDKLNDYFTSGTVSTNGTGSLAGSVGSGTIS